MIVYSQAMIDTILKLRGDGNSFDTISRMYDMPASTLRHAVTRYNEGRLLIGQIPVPKIPLPKEPYIPKVKPEKVKQYADYAREARQKEPIKYGSYFKPDGSVISEHGLFATMNDEAKRATEKNRSWLATNKRHYEQSRTVRNDPDEGLNIRAEA